ncbi:13435_t:CDS:2 [Funneliformis mosseae]|uniref:13435_t:CDS:1 n=1 Tax=Funneliformis mosseae TaxID=27381 RepID=A0A9N9FHM5_FUNMO|nr:13435_t:CDS:2 [Funneliformis mosseae]
MANDEASVAHKLFFGKFPSPNSNARGILTPILKFINNFSVNRRPCFVTSLVEEIVIVENEMENFTLNKLKMFLHTKILILLIKECLIICFSAAALNYVSIHWHRYRVEEFLSRLNIVSDGIIGLELKYKRKFRDEIDVFESHDQREFI